MEKPYGISRPMVLSDLKAYSSPLGDGVIDGRAARREHLKRTGCRETDPSEWRPTYINPEFAAKRGLAWDRDGARAEAERRAEAGRMLAERK
jgi:hypothetical protein